MLQPAATFRPAKPRPKLKWKPPKRTSSTEAMQDSDGDGDCNWDWKTIAPKRMPRSSESGRWDWQAATRPKKMPRLPTARQAESLLQDPVPSSTAAGDDDGGSAAAAASEYYGTLLQDQVPSSTAAGDDDDGGSAAAAAAAAAASESDGTGSSTGLDPGPGGAEVAAGGDFDNDAPFRTVRRREIVRALLEARAYSSSSSNISSSVDITYNSLLVKKVVAGFMSWAFMRYASRLWWAVSNPRS